MEPPPSSFDLICGYHTINSLKITWILQIGVDFTDESRYDKRKKKAGGFL